MTKSSHSRKRIGIATWEYDLPFGGLGRAMQWIGKALNERGFEVFIMQGARNRWWYTCSAPLLLEQWSRSSRLDCVMIPTGPGGLFVPVAPKMCPLIAISYHTYFQQSRSVPGEGWKKIFVPWERRTLRGAKKVLCYSADTKSILEERYGCPPASISYLPQIFDLEAWSPYGSAQKEKGRCVCVARLERRKGIDVLLRAWPEVQERNPDARLTVVGNGSLASDVDALVRRFPDTVDRLPSLPRGELIALVRRAEIALCPSYLEGFGLAAAEAMAAGTAVIAGDAHGLRSLVSHGETGLLVEPGNVAGLSDAIVYLLSSEQLCRELAHNAVRHISSRFSTVTAVDALQNAIEDV